jgi:hypothetical protein
MDLMWVVFAHFIADWGLQNPWVAENKGKYWMVMIGHCMVWTALVCLALNWLGLLTLWKVVFLFVGHAIVDKLKCATYREGREWLLYHDQVFHILQCAVVTTL